MTTLNAYASLAEYKAFVTARAGTTTVGADDDSVVEQLLKAASRLIDDSTDRHFYPIIQTRYFDVPKANDLDPRMIKMDDDLLEVITLVNGDGTTIPSTEYTLKPRNDSPHFGIRLVDNSTYIWASDGAGDLHDVIAVTGIWGFHNRYNLAWSLGSTLNEALDDNETAIDVTSGTLFAVGNIIKVENEFGYVSAVVTNTLTSTRGANGSTASSHLTALNVYIWQHMEDLKLAVLETAMRAYKRRFGQSSGGTETITGAGVVITPADIPAFAREFIKTHRRYL